MSQGERQEWAGTAAAVAAPPPKSGAGAAAALRSTLAPETTHPAASPWEMLYRGASPDQQAGLLALASKQGLLYSHQLPPVSSPRGPAPADEPRTWNLLGKLLAGQFVQLEPVRVNPMQMIDEALDETQRYAVAAALATPDVCLIQGLPGTGKSRVAAEIVTQAAQRGDRILLVSPHPAALDVILERVGSDASLCAIRCLGPEEQAAQLPPAVRALTFQERTVAIRNNAVRAARDSRQAAELECARRRHQEPLWPKLEELASAVATCGEALAQAEAKMGAVSAEVAAEVAAAAGRVGTEARALQRAGEEQSAQLDRDALAVERDREQESAKLADLERQIEVIEPLAAAKQRGRWWTWKWWQATCKGDMVGQHKQLQGQREIVQGAIQAANQRLEELAGARVAAAAKAAAAVEVRLQAEIDARQQKIRAAIHRQRADLERHQTLWADLCRQIDPDTLRPTAQTIEAVRAAQEQWQRQRQDDEAHCTFARDWAEFLESGNDSVATRLPGYCNLVAATPAALAADPHFGEATAAGLFDLLVVEEAECLAESEFLKLARRARVWVLLGEPPQVAEPAHAGSSRAAGGRASASGRAQCFHHLWTHLHCDPSSLPYTWFREGERLGCRLRVLTADQRQRLESEPLADRADVELRILALPRARPELAEVLFPGTTTLLAAKEFLFRELQEITVQTASRCLRWSETTQATVLHFTPTPSEASAVVLDNGVREYLDGPNLDQTCKLEFDRDAGWDRPAVEQWIEQHVRLRDLGRAVWLEKSQRMSAALAEVVGDVLGFSGCANSTAPGEMAEPAVEFIAVLGSGKQKGGGRHESRGPRSAEPAPGGLPAIGAGLETDLAGVRSGDRLPNELRGLVPGRGFVNLSEARAIVRKLEDLLHHPPTANGRAGCAGPALAVIALFPAQADLIRHLIQQSRQLEPHAGSIVVGPPSAFRQREAEVVVVSLTRSHSHRAVAYGDGPAGLTLALTRGRRRLVLVGDPGNLVRRSQWRGVLDHLDEAAASREAHVIGQLVRYLQGRGRHQRAFRLWEGNPP